MFIEARSIPNGTKIETDICIIGAGAAGITLAREFTNTSMQVCMVESGDLEFDEKTQSLYKGENIGFPYYDLDALRLRYFGGTTNHWAGASRPLDPIDLEEKDWVQNSGWPFNKSHLDKYYVRAHKICELGPYNYEPEMWESKNSPRLPFQGNRVTTAMYQGSFTPTRFGITYRNELKKSTNVRVFMNANVIDIEAHQDTSDIQKIQIATLENNNFTIKSKIYILATGAIENARLLLACNKIIPAGLGNEHDIVGRYFMEHLSVPGAIFLPKDQDLHTELYKKRDVNGVVGRGTLVLSADTLRKERLLNIRAFLNELPVQQGLLETSEAAASIDAIQEALKRGKIADNLTGNILNIIREIDDTAIYTHQSFFQQPEHHPKAYYLYYQIEQAPNPDSRVILSSKKDLLGMRQVRLNWQFSDHEKRTMNRTNQIMAEEIGRAGLGRIRILPENPEINWPTVNLGLRGAWHQMGTTRMHNDPRKGVVNKNCRIHNISNMYIAGSSVFPTSGYTNPTLTIVALAVRLADHIKNTMK